MMSQLIDAIQTVAITMGAGLLMGLVSLVVKLLRGEDF
jgi:hypothetical protein